MFCSKFRNIYKEINRSIVMKKVMGYVLSAAGLFGLAISQFKPLKDKVALVVPQAALKVLEGSILIISVGVLAVGVFFLMGSRGARQKGKEVPIYKGKEIIGYRVG